VLSEWGQVSSRESGDSHQVSVAGPNITAEAGFGVSLGGTLGNPGGPAHLDPAIGWNPPRTDRGAVSGEVGFSTPTVGISYSVTVPIS